MDKVINLDRSAIKVGEVEKKDEQAVATNDTTTQNPENILSG